MQTTEWFHQLSHSIRLRLLYLLMGGELCVCELEEILGIRQANVSKHLQKLKTAGLVEVHRVRQRAFYRLSPRLKEQRTLLAYLSERGHVEDTLVRDRARFEIHEKTKDAKVYVCNIPEEEKA